MQPLPTYLPTLKLYSERRPFLIYIYIYVVWLKSVGTVKKKGALYTYVLFSLTIIIIITLLCLFPSATSFVTEKYIDTAMMSMFIK